MRRYFFPYSPSYVSSQIAWSHLTQTQVHMLLFYAALRIEAAAQYLVKLNTEDWPAEWHDFFRGDAKFLSECQQAYLTRQTVPLPFPLCFPQILQHLAPNSHLQAALATLSPNDFRLQLSISELLPRWDIQQASHCTPWWRVKEGDIMGVEMYSQPPRYHPSIDTYMEWAETYFQHLWPEDHSPFHEPRHYELDREEERILDRLTADLEQLEKLQLDVAHCKRRRSELRSLLVKGSSDM